jgi:uncharacterized protein YkwD
MGIRRGALTLLAAWTLTVAPAQAQVPDACFGDGAEAVACIVNEGRDSLGLRRLRTHPVLTRAAERYARRMAREDFFSHTDPEGNGPIDRLVAAGYGERSRGRRWKAGEVIGRGTQVFSTPQAMAFMWLASVHHRRVLLGRRYRHVGVGIATVPGPLGAFPEKRYVLYAGRR